MKLFYTFFILILTSTLGFTQITIYEDIPGQSHQDISGVIIETTPTVDISNCSSIEFSIDFSFSDPWEGSGGMESSDECNFGLGCPGDPEDPMFGDCPNCWDFMWIQFMVDGDPIAENLIGEAGTDDSEQSGTFSFIQCVDDESEAFIEIHNMNWASSEVNSYENVMIICWENPIITTNDPICGAQDLTLDGSVNGSDPISSWEWETDGSGDIDDDSAQNTFATGVDDGDEFTLTTTDINGCEGSTSVAVVVGGFDATIDGGGVICDCTDEDTDFIIELEGGVPLYSIVLEVNGINIPGLPGIDVEGIFRICKTDDIFPSIDDNADPVEVFIPSIFFPIDMEVISITDANGCMATINGGVVSYEVAEPPEINQPTPPTYCVGSDGLVDLTIMDDEITGGENYDVIWFEDEDLEDEINDPENYDVSDGTTVWAVVNDGECDSEPIEVGINVNVQPEFTILQNEIVDCGFNPYFLPSLEDVVEVTNGISPFYYLDEDHTMGPIFSIDPEEVIEIFVYDGSAEGCDALVSIPVNISPFPILESPLDQLGGCGQLELPEPEGDFIDTYDYNIEEDGTGTSYQAGDIILPSDGIDVIYLILTSEEGCEIVEELEIILSSAIDYMVDIPSPICDSLVLPPITPSTGAVAYYSATQGMGTQFLPGDIIYAPFDGTLYVFDPTVDRSCASEDTLMLSIGFGPQPIFPSDTTSCDYVVLPEFGGTTGPNIRYSLLNSNFGSSDLYPGDTITINQQLYIHDTLGGCIFVDSMLINVIEPPFTGIDTSIIICQGFSSSLDLMSLLSNPDVGGLWSYPVIPDFDPLDSTVVDLSVLPLGNFTLTYGIESIECGLTTNRVFISVIEPPFGGVNAILDTCVNNQIFNFMSLLGDPDVGGEWSQVTGTDNVDISDSTSVSLNGITAGDYAFLYVIEGEATSEFCDAESASLFITVNPGPNAGEDNAATVCIGDVVDLSTLLSSDADPDGSYEGDGLFFSGTNWNTGAATPGQTYDISYILTSSSIDCPNDTAIIAVTVEEQLTAGDFLSDYMGCHGMTVDLNNYLNNASPGGYFTLGADFSEVVVDDMYTFDFDNNELISYIVEGFGSCPSDTIQFEFQVTDQPEITLDIINPSICSGNINDATILNFDATSGAETTVQIFDTNSGNLIYESTDYLIGLNNLFISPTGTPFEVLNDTLFVGNIGGNYNIVVNAVRGIMNCPMFEPLEGNIEVIQQYIEVIDVSLCEGDAYDFRGSTYLQSEVINVPSNFPGCDSLFNLNIENYDQVTGLVEGTFCIGDNIDVLNMTYATDTSYTETFSGMASFGCDSIVDIDISFQSVAVGAVNESLCENQNIIIEGETFDINNPTGQIDLPGGSVSGCDSLINVNISFINSVDFELISTICPGESVIVGPDTYDETNLTGTTTLTGLAAGGCDSLVNVALTLLSHSMSEVNPTICATEEVVVNGSIYNFSNPTGQEILPNAEGCDSTINVDLQFYQEASFGLNQDICEDEEVVVGSDVYNQGNLNGTTTLANASSNGCDSTVNVNLNLVGASIFDLSSTLCPGESLQIGSETYDEANTSGTTVLTDASESGCDSIVNVILTYTSPLAELEPTILCPNESTGMLQVLSVEALSLPLTIVINNGTPLTVTNLPFETQVNVGINDVLLTDNNGCFYNEMLEVMQITSGNISVTANQTSLNNYQLGVNADFPIIEYQWSPNQELSCDMCSDPGAVITETTQIDVTVTSDNGCTFTESVILEYTTPPVIIKHFLANSIDLANPPNDIFFVQTNDDNAMVMEMMIFDRWGNKVFGVENVPPNDASVGWDGRMNDRKVNQGVYVYTIIMLSSSGEEEILVGNVTVFR